MFVWFLGVLFLVGVVIVWLCLVFAFMFSFVVFAYLFCLIGLFGLFIIVSLVFVLGYGLAL